MAVKAKEDDLFKLAAEGGTAEAKAGLPLGGILLGPDGRSEVSPAPDEGFKTRVKPPGEKTEKAAPSPRRPSRASASEKQLSDVAETLEEKFATIFAMLSGVVPVTAAYGVDNAPKAINALMDIGKRRPAVMKALLKIADGADGLELGKFILGLVVAVQVDFRKLEGTELPARVFGVTEILDKYFLNPEHPDNAEANPNVMEQTTNGQRFQPVA